MILPEMQFLIFYFNIAIEIGLLIFIWRKKTEPWNRLLLFLITLIIVGISLLVLEKRHFLDGIRAVTLARIPFYATFLVAVVFCYITFAFTRSFVPKTLWTVITTLWITIIALILEFPVPILNFAAIQDNGIIIVGWGFFLLAAILHMLFAYHRTVYPLHRNRYKYWFLVVVILVIGSGLVFIRQTAAGFSLSSVSAILISLTSLSHELPDIRQILKKTIAFLLTTLLSVITYAGAFVVFSSSNTARSSLGSATILLAILLAVVLVLMANPSINIFHRWVSQQISGDNLDSSRMLGNYSKDISNIIDINQLAQEIIQKITEGMHIQYGELLVVEKNESNYLLQIVDRNFSIIRESKQVYGLALGSPIVQWFLREKHSITQYDLDFHPQLVQTGNEDKEWISNYKMDILVPIYSQNEWIGVLALGPKQNGDRFFEEEIGTLQVLADQTAIGLRNARLYEDLKQQNTKNENLNIELSKANEELARLDQAKSDFISIASHEIRTPLTQIIGYNDILNDMVKSGNIPRTAGLQMIDGVRKASRRLEDIVDTMFDVSQLDTRTMDLHFTNISIMEVITQSSEKWMAAFEVRKQIFSIKPFIGSPFIQADSRRLKQVFSNLIQNAIKYTPDGGQIQVVGRVIQQNSLEATSFVEVAITDTGIGINHEDIEKVFEKFYRVGNVMLHSTGETKFKGAGPGLGLTITRGIVEAHGGKIWAESPGNDDLACPGSTFYVLLPVTQ
jgi:signal transduction histidine kinase